MLSCGGSVVGDGPLKPPAVLQIADQVKNKLRLECMRSCMCRTLVVLAHLWPVALYLVANELVDVGATRWRESLWPTVICGRHTAVLHHTYIVSLIILLLWLGVSHFLDKATKRLTAALILPTTATVVFCGLCLATAPFLLGSLAQPPHATVSRNKPPCVVPSSPTFLSRFAGRACFTPFV